jgi:hypothetical protein
VLANLDLVDLSGGEILPEVGVLEHFLPLAVLRRGKEHEQDEEDEHEQGEALHPLLNQGDLLSRPTRSSYHERRVV